MVGNGHWGRSAVRVGPAQRDVLALANDLETECSEGPKDPGLVGVYRELAHRLGHGGLGDEGVEDRVLRLQPIGTEGLQVKTQGRGYVL